jgi:hypothetical protein
MRSCSESSVGLGHRNVASKFALPSCDVGVLENRAALSCKKCVAISLGHVRKSAPPDLPSPHLSLPKCRLLHSRNSTCTMRLLMGGALACSSLGLAKMSRFPCPAVKEFPPESGCSCQPSWHHAARYLRPRSPLARSSAHNSQSPALQGEKTGV